MSSGHAGVRKACREGLEMEPGGPGLGFTRSCFWAQTLGPKLAVSGGKALSNLLLATGVRPDVWFVLRACARGCRTQ